MKLIPTNRTEFRLMVDDKDEFNCLANHWSVCMFKNKIMRITCSIKGKDIGISNFILNYYGELDIDHKDGNKLNNQAENLRKCSDSQNLCNRPAPSQNMTGYKGVSFRKDRGKYRATIQFQGIQRGLGCFSTPQEAALAYNKAALKYHGEFAYFNKV